MIDLHVEISGVDDLLGGLSGIKKQIPYATSLAINNTLNDIQSAVRSHVHQAFIVRRAQFIDRSIYIGPQDRARKDRLTGTVRINPARDVLAKFEDDTQKVPTRARSLAVPVFRQGAPGIIISRSDPLNVKKLMAAMARRGGRMRRGKYTPAQLGKQSIFLVRGRDGRSFIVERTASATRVLYAFVPSVPIEPDLNFAEIGMATALDRWDTNASAAIEHALATAR